MTRRTYRLAWTVFGLCGVSVLVGAGIGWFAFVIALAIILSGCVVYRPLEDRERRAGLAADDVYAKGKSLHPSSWPLESDGINPDQ